MSSRERCVQFLFEKRRHRSQRQRALALLTRISSLIWALKADLKSTHSHAFQARVTASSDAITGVLEWSTTMRTTVTLDDDLLAKAIKMMGGLDRSTVLREGLKALIERESAMRLAKLGGTQPQLQPVPRRRASATT
jgi:Arc/MetJ family transcription regulator